MTDPFVCLSFDRAQARETPSPNRTGEYIVARHSKKRRSGEDRPQQGGGSRRPDASRYSGDLPPIVLSHHEYASGDGRGRGGPRPAGADRPRGYAKPGSPGPGRQAAAGPPQPREGRPGSRRNGRRRGKPGGAPAVNAPQPASPANPPLSHSVAASNKPSAFDLFCAYHLGITADGGYKPQNANEIARRFGINSGELKQLLTDYGIDSATVINADFDMAMAQLDIMVAPEGINRRELAKALFDEFLAAPKTSRDWEKELRDDAEANRQIYGK